MAENGKPTATTTKPVCGIVMPISAIGDYTAAHWSDVLEILSDTIKGAGFNPNLVSNAQEVAFIHKTIVQNVYDNPMVVCDVSGKNPNVMFELGLRLAFDKPTVIVKDDKTAYTFDTSPIEHLEYPHDLRFKKIIEFKERLADKIKNTHAKATTDPQYSAFLKHFGEFTVAKLDKKELPGQEFILEELRGMRLELNRLETTRRDPFAYSRIQEDEVVLFSAKEMNAQTLNDVIARLRKLPFVKRAFVDRSPDGEDVIAVQIVPPTSDSARRTLMRVVKECWMKNSVNSK